MWRSKYNIPKSLFGRLPNGEEVEFTVFYFISNILGHIDKAPSPNLLRKILNVISSDENNESFPSEMLMTDTVNDGAGFERYSDLVGIVRRYVFRCSEEKLQEIYKLIFPEYPARLVSAGEDTVLLGDGKSKENIERTLKFIFLVFLWLLESYGRDFCRKYYYTFESLMIEDLFRKFPEELIDGKENKEKARIMALSLEGLLVHSNNVSLNICGIDAKFVPRDFCYFRDQKMADEIKNFYGIANTSLEDVDLDAFLETVPFLARNLF